MGIALMDKAFVVVKVSWRGNQACIELDECMLTLKMKGNVVVC